MWKVVSPEVDWLAVGVPPACCESLDCAAAGEAKLMAATATTELVVNIRELPLIESPPCLYL